MDSITRDIDQAIKKCQEAIALLDAYDKRLQARIKRLEAEIAGGQS